MPCKIGVYGIAKIINNLLLIIGRLPLPINKMDPPPQKKKKKIKNKKNNPIFLWG